MLFTILPCSRQQQWQHQQQLKKKKNQPNNQTKTILHLKLLWSWCLSQQQKANQNWRHRYPYFFFFFFKPRSGKFWVFYTLFIFFSLSSGIQVLYLYKFLHICISKAAMWACLLTATSVWSNDCYWHRPQETALFCWVSFPHLLPGFLLRKLFLSKSIYSIRITSHPGQWKLTSHMVRGRPFDICFL